jgi:hypothetical protein
MRRPPHLGHPSGRREPEQWTQSLLVSMVRSGKPMRDIVRQWLTATRTDILATYADVHLHEILQSLDAAIAAADASPCSPHA